MGSPKRAQGVLIVLFVLAVLLVPCFQPVQASAPASGVITIGSQEYPSLQAAVAAASPGDTLRLSGGDMVVSQTVVIPQNSNLTLDLGGNTLVSRVDTPAGRMLSAVSSGHFTLKNGKLRAEDVNGDGFSGGALASNGSYLTLDNIQAEGFRSSSSGAVVNAQAGNHVIIITNSFFEKNAVISTWSTSSLSGGAIEINGSAQTAKVRVEGNHIANNSVTGGYYAYGGGITIRGSGQFEVKNNVLTSNQTTAQTLLYNNYWSHGGAMGILSAVSRTRQMHVVLEGNVISNNRTQLFGGGIYLYQDLRSGDSLDLRSGSFLGNHSDYAGGAIDFSVHGQPTLFLERVLMTNNTARTGGGIWACPTARVQTFSTLGGAITGNEINQTPSGSVYRPSGHDVRFEGWNTQIPGILTDNDPALHMLTVRQRTYLGDALTWYLDNPGDLYQPGDPPLDTDTLTDNPNTQGLISQLNAEAEWLTRYQEAAALVFMNNTARFRGGAISTNSDVQIGQPTDLAVTVTKTWLDEKGSPLTLGLPAQVEVQLLARDEKGGIHPLEKVMLNPENGWSHTFIQLPSQLWVAGEILNVTYQVKETTTLSGFEATYEPLRQTGEQAYALAITNKKVPVSIVRLPLQVKKVLLNGTLKEGQFTFQLKDRQGTVIAQASNRADGSVTFPERTFSQEVSNWMYTIHEVEGTEQGITNDKTVYTVIVNVRLVDGRLKAQMDIQKDGTPFAGEMTFVNRTAMPSTGDAPASQIVLLLSLALVLSLAAIFLHRRKRS